MILEIKELTVERGGIKILDIPEFHVKEAEVLSLIGPNGAGKTSLLQTLCGLHRPARGSMVFQGRTIGTEIPASEYRRCVTMVFQEPLLFDTTVAANVAAGLKLRGAERKEIKTAVAANLERFGITHLAARSARTLSGGEAQRTSLARAFAINPEILLLDEPFAALDAPTKATLMDDLEKVMRESGATAVFATHDRSEALRLSDRIGVMTSGRIVQIGSTEEVMNHPADEFVASFVGMETVLNGKVTRRGEGTFAAFVAGQEIEIVGEAELGDAVLICIRPELVTLSREPATTPSSARNVFKGKVERLVSLGLYHRVVLDCGFPLVAYVTTASVRDLGLAEGTIVSASFKATAIHGILKRKS